MIDRYKFRGRKKNSGDWFVGDLCQRGGIYIFPPDGLDSYDNYEVDPATVGQCTGLMDKNGVLIFEGDILQFSSRAIWYRTTLFFKDANKELQDFEKYPYERRVVKIPDDYDWLLGHPNDLKDYWEIIGNVHDNPEIVGGVE